MVDDKTINEELKKQYGVITKEEFEKIEFVKVSYKKGNQYRISGRRTLVNSLNALLYADTDTDIRIMLIWVTK